ncbi:MAG: hypothetical protein LBJ08_09900 [Bifidobacteriaceae bacterium]|nr:hypothetical protein [Bifidobacteriaceae bacterium]
MASATFTGPDGPAETVTYTYDALGRITAIRDAAGLTRSYV